MHAAQPATVLRREQTITRNTILSVRAIRASHRIYSSLRDTRLRFNRNTPKLFHRDKYSNTFDSTRHADVSFFFYCVIETLATLLRADLIYYPCDCTKLLITELRQLRRTTYTFVHASYLSCAYSSQRTCSFYSFIIFLRSRSLHFESLKSAFCHQRLICTFLLSVMNQGN